MSDTQISGLVLGIAIMFFFGYGWSLETLRAEHSLYRLIKRENSRAMYILLHFFGLLLGLSCVILCSTPLYNMLLATDSDKKKIPQNYVVFLDISVIKNENREVNKKALNVLNVFLEKTKAKIVVISNDRVHKKLLTNYNIDILKLICANYGIRGFVLGSVPYTKGTYTRHQEIKLWCKATKIKFDSCVIIDKFPLSPNDIAYTVNIDKVLTSKHLLTAIEILETKQDPTLFKIRTQKYYDTLKSRKQTSG